MHSRSGATDLESFLTALRRPLEYVAQASPETAGRTRIPAGELAARGRDLQSQLDERRRAVVETLCRHLEQYEGTPPDARAGLVRRCLGLLEHLGGPSTTPTAGSPAQREKAPPARYEATQDDPSDALERLSASVQFVHGVGPRRAEILRKFGIATVEDLLYHLPFRYEDRRQVRTIGELRVGEEASVVGEIAQLAERVVGRARRRILEGVLRDESGLLALTWYHQVSYFRSRYRSGQRCLVHGRVERAPSGTKRMVHPEIDLAADETGQGILPVYGKPTTMTVGAMRKLVQQAAADFAPLVPSVLPEPAPREAAVVDLGTALRGVHLPGPEADVDELSSFRSLAHRSLVFDELFFLQLGMGLRRRAVAQERGLVLPRRGDLTDELRGKLPFALTRAQNRVLEEIWADMGSPRPMHRLVQGDVGSGKTLVALFAALVAIENGYQAAFMAPTELLAEQHYRTIGRFAEQLGLRCTLLTSDRLRSERAHLYDQLASGEIQLAVGTHALIQESVRFRKIGLGIIDEQHRFGVLQRAALRRMGERGEDGRTPDILLMTATPIPRTLAMTIYGDLDVSILDELPPGRQPVRTLIRNEAERQKVYQLVRAELAQGRQGYVVYPLVESSEKEDLRDATTMAQELGRAVFPEYRVGLVHGRMKAEEKEAVMRRFHAGDLRLLVSTTVIEVGVDVPNATIMVVEHAERFGLSQLHQLRGRVGRGSERALCILMAPYRRGEETYRRLKAMADTSDGFRIAEVDLEIRGPGEFLGVRQSGLPDFRVANLVRDSRLLSDARRVAEQWLDQDPTLTRPESRHLRTVLQHRWAGRLGLAETG